MILENVSILADGVEITQDCREKIHQIATVTKKISKSPTVSIRLVRNGVIVEGLLWGMLDERPIGAFNRGLSVSIVLEGLGKRVKKDCLKILQSKVRQQSYEPAGLADVG